MPEDILKAHIETFSASGAKQKNQDACGFFQPFSQEATAAKGITAAIADGVSACERAKEASECCVQGFLIDYYSTPYSWSTERSAGEVISALNTWLYSQSNRSFDNSALLTTLSVLIMKSNTAHIFHMGDSRVYHLRDGKLSIITTDHSIRVSKQKSYLTKAMGFDLKACIDYLQIPLKTGDVFLMTTDGVHDYLAHDSLEKLLNNESSSNEIVNAALAVGSLDNVSAVKCIIKSLPYKGLTETFDELAELPVPPVLEKGIKINGFEIVSTIHASSRTHLYLARDLRDGSSVVLKTPSVSYSDNPHYLTRFLYEEWVGARIFNPNVVKVRRFAEEKNFLFYALEYIKGITLRQWIDAHPNPQVDEVMKIVRQIIRGLRAFHRREMLHCDLKPENIMIDEKDQVKLIDFGSTRIAGVSELVTQLSSDDIHGTYGYSAPEVITENRSSRMADQFSLAVIVYEMFSGRLPYKKPNANLSKKRLYSLVYRSLLEYNPHIPIWIDGAVAKACSLYPEQRYESLSEFLYELEHPNPGFIKASYKKCTDSSLNNYRVFAALSLAFNVILLLILVR